MQKTNTSDASLVLTGCDLLELRANVPPGNVHGGGAAAQSGPADATRKMLEQSRGSRSWGEAALPWGCARENQRARCWGRGRAGLGVRMPEL